MGFVGMGSRACALEMEARQGKVKDPDSLSGALQDELRRVALFAERYRSEGGQELAAIVAWKPPGTGWRT